MPKLPSHQRPGQQWWLMTLCQTTLSLVLLVPAQLAAGPRAETAAFNAVAGISRDFVVAVGAHGMIAHLLGDEGMRIMPSGTTQDLLDVNVATHDFAVAVGAGVVLRWDGARWHPLALEKPELTYSKVWTSPNRRLVLYGGSGNGAHWVCPWIPGADRQPFCRRFKSPMRAACGGDNDVLVVFASGAIYRVNNAVLGFDGRFEPAYAEKTPLQLKTAWLPAIGCDLNAGLPEVFAIDAQKGPLHFTHRSWHPLDLDFTPKSTKQTAGNLTYPAFGWPDLSTATSGQIRLGSRYAFP